MCESINLTQDVSLKSMINLKMISLMAFEAAWNMHGNRTGKQSQILNETLTHLLSIILDMLLISLSVIAGKSPLSQRYISNNICNIKHRKKAPKEGVLQKMRDELSVSYD